MNVVVTGAHGFLGWHLRVRLKACSDAVVIPVGRDEFMDPSSLALIVQSADVVVHVAGANRGDPTEVARVNIDLAHRLVNALRHAIVPPAVVFANSVRAGSATPYGASKAAASEILGGWAHAAGARFVDVVLPNLFGEHGRPYYNSFVATFCHDLAHDRVPNVHDAMAEVELLHAQGAAQALIDAMTAPAGRYRPSGVHRTVGQVLSVLNRLRRMYRGADLPEINDEFERALFSTYRSAVFPQGSPTPLTAATDRRGSLLEVVRQRSRTGQTFLSTTAPGETRGDHFHLAKLERFVVLSGTAEIRLRRVLDDEIVRFEVSGSEPAFVDMPAMWAHAIENTGTTELVVLFWADELFDPDAPDTFAERVVPALAYAS
jgi:UDP-2-acetamido-2,6-beta-L-arabino-hexul-4-ose reductase